MKDRDRNERERKREKRIKTGGEKEKWKRMGSSPPPYENMHANAREYEGEKEGGEEEKGRSIPPSHVHGGMHEKMREDGGGRWTQ